MDLGMFETLRDLCSDAGLSGHEGRIAERAAELLRPLCDKVSTDRLSNVRGVRGAAVEDAPSVMLVAHIDEIGMMVTKIDEGFLRFCTIGGIDARVLPAREVRVMTDPPLFGVITSVPPHLQTADENKKPFELSKLCIDIGLSQQQAAERVPIGTPVVYNETAKMLGDKLVSSKSLDDRACFVMLLRTLELLKDKPLAVNLTVVASTMEEINDGGAKVAAYADAPDYAIAVDVTHGDTPDSGSAKTCKLGGGIPILVGTNANRKLGNRLFELAKAHDITAVPEVVAGPSGTDAVPMEIVGYGTATGVVSLPCRYMHTPSEVVSLDDMEAGARLLAAFCAEGFGREVV